MSRLNLGAITAYAIAKKHGFEGTEEEWLKSLKDNINIVKGEGKYSFVQKTGEGGSHGSSDEKPKTQGEATGRNAVALGVQGQSIGDCTLTAGYQAKALEKACVAFGTGIAGRTSAEWIAYYWDVNTWSTPNWNGVGSLKQIEFQDLPTNWENKGIIKAKKDINGNATIDDRYYYVLGPSNTKYGGYLLNPSFSVGQGSYAKGQCSASIGYGSKANADHSFAIGQSTNSNANHGFAGGYATNNNSPYGFAYGYYIETSNSKYQNALGKYNKKNDDALFQVGNGTSTQARSNAFEVLKDGRAKVKTAPQEDDDIVRKADLKNLGGGTITDIKVDGVSVVKDGVADIQTDTLLGDVSSVLNEIIALQEAYIGTTFDELHEYAQDIVSGGEA